MRLASDTTRLTAGHSESEATSGERDDAELDLERLVWDPEYRAAMRPVLAGDA